MWTKYEWQCTSLTSWFQYATFRDFQSRVIVEKYQWVDCGYDKVSCNFSSRKKKKNLHKCPGLWRKKIIYSSIVQNRKIEIVL